MTVLEATLASIQPVDPALARRVQARLDGKTKPPGSLGRLEQLVGLAICKHQRYIISSLIHSIPDILVPARGGNVHECARHVVLVQLA